MSKQKKLPAKKYLEQLEMLDIKINQKQIQLDDLKLRATSTGGFNYGEKVKTSLSGNKLCEDVTRYVALEQEINEDIDRFVDTKNMIINQIQALENIKYISLLFMRYVQYKKLETIADEMNYSSQYIRELHKMAIENFEDTYTNLH